jgi:hypothetical protein
MKQQIVWLILCFVGLAGCQSPFLTFPGGALQGDVATTDSFAFASDYKLLQLETSLDKPYSVWLRSTVIGGDLYIDAAPARKWAEHLAGEPRVRLKLGKHIYPAIAVVVSEQKLTEQFLSGRILYRLDPLNHD